jgi:hypothetical protein
MAAIQSSLELVDEIFTHVFLFPYHVYCFGRKKLEERRKEKEKEEEEGGMKGKDGGVSKGSVGLEGGGGRDTEEEDRDGESLRLLVGK